MTPEQISWLIGEGISIIRTALDYKVRRGDNTCYIVYDYKNEPIVICELSPKDSKSIIEDLRLRIRLHS